MALPTPEPGLVIRYSYLWHSESIKGRLEGIKNRPCAIIIATQDAHNKSLVSVAPITHTKPSRLDEAIEIPQATKTRLGLSDSPGERSWVILSEINRFIWPGPDMRSITHDNTDVYEYGLLPPAFYEQLKNKLLEVIRKSRTSVVKRTTE